MGFAFFFLLLADWFVSVQDALALGIVLCFVCLFSVAKERFSGEAEVSGNGFPPLRLAGGLKMVSDKAIIVLRLGGAEINHGP